MAAAQRRSERESARRYRVLLAEQRRHEQLAQAHYEVQLQQSYLEFITSLHRDAFGLWDWREIAHAPPPVPAREREAAAVAALTSYRPSLIDRTLGREQKRVTELQHAALEARQQDQAEHEQESAQWQWLHTIAHGVLRGERAAFVAVLEHLAPFDEIEQLGASVTITRIQPAYVEAEVAVRNPEIVPHQEVSLTARGTLSRKQMPKAKYWAYYQDYVCSAALRVARELLHLLPIETAFVHVATVARSTATGHMEEMVLLSVQCARRALLRLNFDHVDASDAVQRLPHSMQFKKTAGFFPVERIDPTASLTVG